MTLSISPSNAVPGQQITIRGKGFEDGKPVTGITFGTDDPIDIEGGEDKSTSAGNVSFTYNVPLGIGDGSHKVQLKVGARTGAGSITVPKPAISISPTESLIDTTITVTGTGFASNNRVEVSTTRKSRLLAGQTATVT